MSKFLLNERLRMTGSDLDQDLATHSPDAFTKIVCANSIQTFTECGSKIGIAVSMVEAIMTMSRVLWMMDLSSKEVQEALKDLKETYELNMLMTLETESPQGRMHDDVWRNRYNG